MYKKTGTLGGRVQIGKRSTKQKRFIYHFKPEIDYYESKFEIKVVRARLRQAVDLRFAHLSSADSERGLGFSFIFFNADVFFVSSAQRNDHGKK
jgi:hypothetical protein